MKSQIMDLTGHQYGRLTVVDLHSHGRSVKWNCLCACGVSKPVQANNLRSGHTQSCGCYQDETKGLHSVTHGSTHTPAYTVWSTMRQRCQNPNHDKYIYYGGRGITVCPEWHSFDQFLRDMGQPPKGYQIDRENNDLGYNKANCKWVPRLKNMRNKSNNRMVNYNGRDVCMSQLAEEEGVSYSALRRRIIYWNMPVQDAIDGARNRRVHGQKNTKHPKKPSKVGITDALAKI